MRSDRFNPFRPGSIVTPWMFVGRVEEIISINRALYQTKNGNPAHFLIHGERGIGKSSLMVYVDAIGSQFTDGDALARYNFLSLNIELEPDNTYADVIYKIGNELARQVSAKRPAASTAKAAWDFLKQWEVMGVKFNGSERQVKPGDLLDELAFAVEKSLSALGSTVDGILILLDEADKPGAKANLGQFVKIFTERLAKRGCHNVCIGLAGVSGVIRELKKSHESSTRIFDIFTLQPLLPEERISVIDRGLRVAEEKNGIKTDIKKEAAERIAELSEGYPNFIQQFAYCAFNEDQDDCIDLDDVLKGANNPQGGAIEQLGLKYFEELYFDQIGSDEYRRVLRAMSESLDGFVTKAHLKKETALKDTTLNNALRALSKRRIILPKPGTKGVYRLPTKSFAVWIKAVTAQAGAAP
ncbi:MAG: hypothetical protein JWO13_3419 [Acidobacteriales bacterium]|nr:hypothetical protein [Terriglobales bacterium]